MESLKILFASPEVVPFSKTGGLADVAGVLPRVLAEMGHDVKIITPKYGSIDKKLISPAALDIVMDIPMAHGREKVQVFRQNDPALSLEYLFVGNDAMYDRGAFYVDPATGKDFVDNDIRFIFFSLAALETVKKLKWAPDIIHANDWQTALLPTFLATSYKNDVFFENTKSVYTIHNLAYQGVFPEKSFANLGLDKALFYATGPFEFYGKVNFMKSAIHFAHVINTVSERYAEEIRGTEEYGCGLEGVLDSRASDLFGILNGVDYTEWSPTRDKYIPYKYTVSNLSGKRNTKVELVGKLGLPFREHAPLLGMITRLADQKGLDLIAEIADEIFELDIQMVVLGTGDKKYHQLFTDLEKKYPDKLKAILAFDIAMAHWIEAGADAFLMPSRYEPCGLNQMYSLKYGTLPIVRATGGLADTITDIASANGSGTGFVFDEYDSTELLRTIERAVALYPRKRMWRAVVKEAMRQDYSWAKSARRYEELYRVALSK